MDRHTRLCLTRVTNRHLLHSVELCSALCGSLDGEEVLGENGGMYVYN